MDQNDTPVFSISPNPTSMYLTPDLRDALSRFRRAINRRQGLCTILGDNGLGKSTLLRYLAVEYEAQHDSVVVSYLPDSRKANTPFEFLKIMSADFDIKPKRSQAGQIDALEEFLSTCQDEGKNVVVFIDEAQRLSLDSFELIRALLNFESDTHKLIQVVIAGQVDLQRRLQHERYKAFRSRIMANVEMRPLTKDETVAMIRHRLANWGVANPFSDSVLSKIYECSAGVPRKVLAICQQSSDLAAESSPPRKVTVADVERADRAISVTDPASPELVEVAT